MCVIIANPKGEKISKEITARCIAYNPHGFGITYLDTNKTYKTLDMSEAYEHMESGRPFIAHYRLKTIGDITLDNCHPNVVRRGEVAYMNGTIKDFPLQEGESDTAAVTRFLKNFKDITSDEVAAMLEWQDARWALVTKGKYRLINKKAWKTIGEQESVLYSKPNIGESALVAVYDNKKLGYSDDLSKGYSYLKSAYVGAGVTNKEMALCIEEDDTPKLLNTPYKDGYNVEVDVFAMAKSSVERELREFGGHMETIEVKMQDGTVLNALCCVYKDSQILKDDMIYETYIEPENITKNDRQLALAYSQGSIKSEIDALDKLLELMNARDVLERGAVQAISNKSGLTVDIMNRPEELYCYIDDIDELDGRVAEAYMSRMMMYVDGVISIYQNCLYFCNDQFGIGTNIERNYGFSKSLFLCKVDNFPVISSHAVGMLKVDLPVYEPVKQLAHANECRICGADTRDFPEYGACTSAHCNFMS